MTPKRRLFIREYLVDLNATRAYRAAGFKGSDNVCAVEAGKLLRNPQIAEAVQKAMDERAERTGITAERVLGELAKIGFSDIRKAVKWYSQANVATVDDIEGEIEDGSVRFAVANQVELISSGEIDDETAAAIAEVSMTAQGGLKIKFHDKRAALVDIGRHLKLFVDRVDVNFSDDAAALAQARQASE